MVRADLIVQEKLKGMQIPEEPSLKDFDISSYIYYFMREYHQSFNEIKNMKMGTFWHLVKFANLELQKRKERMKDGGSI